MYAVIEAGGGIRGLRKEGSFFRQMLTQVKASFYKKNFL